MKAWLLAVSLALAATAAGAQAGVSVLRYAHMNTPDSVAGRQAVFFAAKLAEYSGGALRVEVFPSSLLGTLDEQLAQLASGVVAIHHNTAAGFGSIFEDFAVLDTPFAYRDVAQLLRVVDPSSPVMARLGEGLLKKGGIRILYTFYFGTRQLTCDRPVRRPGDLRGVKIRSIPYPMYELAVEGLGAVPTPIDWAATPTALAAKAVAGQENPVDTILSARLYESQPYLMLTGHIMGAEIVCINDEVWQSLPKSSRDQIARAAAETSAYASRLTLEEEKSEQEELRAKGMKIIGPAEGLNVTAFAARTKRLLDERYDGRWADYYRMIDAMR